MEVSGQLHTPATFPTTHESEDWGGSRAGRDALDRKKVVRACMDSKPKPSSLYPGHYTDHAVRGLMYNSHVRTR
jgi:hypothetical protein